MINKCPLCVIVGDNCDIRIQTNHQASDHQIKDCHYFGELLVFSRMTEELKHLSKISPTIRPENINIKQVLLFPHERLQLFESYKVLLGRLIVENIPTFKWMKSILPQHIPHQQEDVMEKKSAIVPLKMLFQNEAKYEDYVHILDETEAILHQYFETLACHVT